MKKNTGLVEATPEQLAEVQAAAEALKESQAVVIGSPAQGNMVSIVDEFSGRSVQIFSSIAQDASFAEKAKLYNAMNDNEGKLADQLGKTIAVQDMVAYPVPFVTEEGEMVELLRVVVVEADGKSWGTAARGIADSLKSIIAIVGPAPWTPALRVTPIQKTTRKGFKTVVLRLEVGE